MDHKHFDEITEPFVEHLMATMKVKSAEYSRGGEKFHNFKSAASRLGCTPERALWGMAEKHLGSVYDIINGIEQGKGAPKTDLLDEKFGDLICYLLLQRGLIIERSLAEHKANPPVYGADMDGFEALRGMHGKMVKAKFYPRQGLPPIEVKGTVIAGTLAMLDVVDGAYLLPGGSEACKKGFKSAIVPGEGRSLVNVREIE